MSYYRDGMVSADFVGLARERRKAQTPGCEHLYLTGCAGNITAGKYNDGSPESRIRLTDRIHRAMVESEQSSKVRPLKALDWKTVAVQLPRREDLDAAGLEALIRDTEKTEVDRRVAALRLACLERADIPTHASRLRLGPGAGLLCLPGEPFIEYQLSAASQEDFVAVAGYGDTGAGYVPLARSYEEGGYEIGASGVSGGAEAVLRQTMQDLLSTGGARR